MSIYSYTVKGISGEEVSLNQYENQVILLVNTASKCGFTDQLGELEELYRKYKNRGFIVLGFPCNQFLFQDPNSNEEILDFCQMNYGVSFPMFAKVKVKGKDIEPIFEYAVKETGGKSIPWNFTKFLFNRSGEIIKRFGSKESPLDFEEEIVALLKE